MPDHTRAATADPLPTSQAGAPPIKFSADNVFYRDLKARVARYFAMTGRSPRDCPQMYVKTLIVFTWTIASYVLLVFLAQAWWLALLGALSLGLAITAIGFNVQHDGGHRAYSRRPWVNRLMAMSLDLVGASSFIWDHKHNTLHHTYANIDDHDDDIDVGLLGRLSPHQKRLAFHRLQHLYMWPLYGLLAIKWHLVDDFRNLAVGRIGPHRFARPRGRHLVVFVGGKVIFFSLAFVIPMLLHPAWLVLTGYVLVCLIQGVVLSVVFQLAHVVEPAQFPVPEPTTGRVASEWAVHQVETTVNFSRHNPLVTWYVGGLNFQVEHHLFPRICHVHYPRLSRLVEKACARHGVRYNSHGSFIAGVVSHFRFLRRMGRPEIPAA
jgi:linoleoyl-CoA desaturase